VFDELFYCGLIRDAIRNSIDMIWCGSSFNVTISLKAADFDVDRYSSEVSVAITLTK